VIYHLLQFFVEKRYFGLEGHYGYENPLFRATIAILVAFLVVLMLGPRAIRLLIHMRLGDIPDFDHKDLNELTRHKTDVPTMGGILVLFGIIVAVLLLADLTSFYVITGLFCMLYLGTLGFVDDWLKLRGKGQGNSRDGLKLYQKLLFQIGLGVLLGQYIFYRGPDNFVEVDGVVHQLLTLPFVKQPLLLSIPVFMVMTVLVVAGTSNAVNLTDGMDGLAGGCVALCCFVFMILAWVVGDASAAAKLLMPHVPDAGELSVLCGAMMGACLGFLWYNCHPAQVFMGDTGSLPLGGLLGFVAICLRQELMLLIVGGVFVIEAVSVMLQVGYFKITGGKRIFLVAPIHHHFQLKGWAETQVVTRFWLLATLFAALALATTKLR